MTYQSNHVNIMVLDEINIARVEYYFADFLSILEYPKDKWILHIMQLPYGFEAPEHLIMVNYIFQKIHGLSELQIKMIQPTQLLIRFMTVLLLFLSMEEMSPLLSMVMLTLL